jgi:hypothetical protein
MNHDHSATLFTTICALRRRGAARAFTAALMICGAWQVTACQFHGYDDSPAGEGSTSTTTTDGEGGDDGGESGDGEAAAPTGAAVAVTAARSTPTTGGSGGAGGGVSPGKMGMTWRKYFHDDALGQDKVGCTGDCGAYVGDTACTESRPILCIAKDGSGSNGFAPSFYDGWAAGNIGLTPPVAGTTLTSLAAANAQCVSTFGAGWQMAEHHDGGGGWAWRAYGNINDLYDISVASHDPNNRFWVHINDQPGNCWNP